MHPIRGAVPAVLLALLAAASARADVGCGSVIAAVPVSAPLAAPPVAPLRATSWKPRPWRPPATHSARALGLRVAIDPVDGTLSMPTDAGSIEAGRADRELPPLRSIVHPDGSVQLVLDDRFMEFAVARVGPDGRPVWTCVDGASGARQFLVQRAGTFVAPAEPAVKWEDR